MYSFLNKDYDRAFLFENAVIRNINLPWGTSLKNQGNSELLENFELDAVDEIG